MPETCFLVRFWTGLLLFTMTAIMSQHTLYSLRKTPFVLQKVRSSSLTLREDMPISAVPAARLVKAVEEPSAAMSKLTLPPCFLKPSAHWGTSLAPRVSEPRMRSVLCALRLAVNAMARREVMMVDFMRVF